MSNIRLTPQMKSLLADFRKDSVPKGSWARLSTTAEQNQLNSFGADLIDRVAQLDGSEDDLKEQRGRVETFSQREVRGKEVTQHREGGLGKAKPQQGDYYHPGTDAFLITETRKGDQTTVRLEATHETTYRTSGLIFEQTGDTWKSTQFSFDRLNITENWICNDRSR